MTLTEYLNSSGRCPFCDSGRHAGCQGETHLSDGHTVPCVCAEVQHRT